VTRYEPQRWDSRHSYWVRLTAGFARRDDAELWLHCWKRHNRVHPQAPHVLTRIAAVHATGDPG
jgi:hypothetical protein